MRVLSEGRITFLQRWDKLQKAAKKTFLFRAQRADVHVYMRVLSHGRITFLQRWDKLQKAAKKRLSCEKNVLKLSICFGVD